MLHQLAMFEESKDARPFSDISKNVGSLLARLKGSNESPQVEKWPHPELSVGNHCCTLGAYDFWEVEDPGRAKLAPLEGEIQQLLNNYNEELKEREASNVSFSVFMVGRSRTTACPTLVVISTSKRSRQKVLDTIRRSKILDKYPGALLGACPRHPRHPTSGPAQYIASGSEDGSKTRMPLGTRVYIKQDDTLVGNGTPIYVQVSLHEPRFRRATLGGVLQLTLKRGGDPIKVAMTVGHVF